MHRNEAGAATPEEATDERRHYERVQCLLEASVDFSDVLKEIVTVRNLSEGGAKIEVPNDLFIPQQFDLSGLIGGERVRCELVWRKGKEIGVRFVHTD